MDDLWKGISRTHYRGKPTKKYQKFLNLEEETRFLLLKSATDKSMGM